MGSEKVKLVICDDSAHLCALLKEYVDMSEDLECVGTVTDAERCAAAVETSGAELLLLDIQMDEARSGIDMLPRLKSRFPELKIIMLTSHDNSRYIFLSILNGADGYVIKSVDGESMVNVIRETYHKANGASDDVMKAFLKETQQLYDNWCNAPHLINDLVKLSPYEYDILKDIYNGVSYKECAAKRVIEEVTVKTTVSRILKKYGFRSMKDMIKMLKELRIFETW
ncbi:MAG: response regulator transcription factor [Clostridiales bacterium]|jgi:DNA-binding NarL/FixJ family response regulator|nr:response regulator transcription factor [Clostridiales bacterium]